MPKSILNLVFLVYSNLLYADVVDINHVRRSPEAILLESIKEAGGISSLELRLKLEEPTESLSVASMFKDWIRNQWLDEKAKANEEDQLRRYRWDQVDLLAKNILSLYELQYTSGSDSEQQKNSLKSFLANHLLFSRELEQIVEFYIENPEGVIKSYLFKLIEMVLLEAAIDRPYHLAIDLTYKFEIEDTRFLEAYLKSANVHPNSARNYSRSTKLATYSLGFEKPFVTATAEWMQFFLHAQNHTELSVELMSKIPMSLWAMTVEPRRQNYFLQQYGDKIIGPEGRMKVWESLSEINLEAVLDLVLEEIGATDRTDLSEVLNFLKRHHNSLNPTQLDRLRQHSSKESFLIELEKQWPGYYENLKDEMPEDLMDVADFAVKNANEGLNKLLAYRALAEKLPKLENSFMAESEVMSIRKRLEYSLVTNIQTYLSVLKGTVVTAKFIDHEAVAKWSLIIMLKLKMRSEKLNGVLHVLSEEFHSPMFQVVLDNAMSTWNIRKRNESDIATPRGSGGASQPARPSGQFAIYSHPRNTQAPKGQLEKPDFRKKRRQQRDNKKPGVVVNFPNSESLNCSGILKAQ